MNLSKLLFFGIMSASFLLPNLAQAEQSAPCMAQARHLAKEILKLYDPSLMPASIELEVLKSRAEFVMVRATGPVLIKYKFENGRCHLVRAQHGGWSSDEGFWER